MIERALARAGWTRGGGTSVIPSGLGAQAPRCRGTPRREELTRVPHRTAHTAHQLTTNERANANLQVPREPRGRSNNNSNDRAVRRRVVGTDHGQTGGRTRYAPREHHSLPIYWIAIYVERE